MGKGKTEKFDIGEIWYIQIYRHQPLHKVEICSVTPATVGLRDRSEDWDGGVVVYSKEDVKFIERVQNG